MGPAQPSPLELKTELLCKGLVLGDTYLQQLRDQESSFDKGREGGAGPAGGRYFLIPNPAMPGTGESLVNVPFTPEITQHTDLLLDRREGEIVVITKGVRDYAQIRLISTPELHTWQVTDDITFQQIATIHGTDCLGTTLDQQCVYWTEGKKCKFCAIELSWRHGRVLKEKPPHLLARAIKEAQQRGLCNHVTVTTGTTRDPQKGLELYRETFSKLRDEGVNVPLHIQYEPTTDISEERRNLEALKDLGVQTAGVHLEVWDNTIRNDICPGKSHIPLERYFESWRLAVEVFGRSQVHTFQLLGMGEEPSILKEAIEKICEMGVVPFLVPVRDIPGSGFAPANLASRWKDILELYTHAGRMMHRYEVDPFASKAGCVRCGGCSAIPEAYLETN